MLADEVLDERGLNVWAAAHLQESEAAGLRFLPQPTQGAAAHTKKHESFMSGPWRKINQTKKLFFPCKIFVRYKLYELSIALCKAEQQV